jgi:hypothetical protein
MIKAVQEAFEEHEIGPHTLAQSGVAIITGDSMADAAQKVVKAVGK